MLGPALAAGRSRGIVRATPALLIEEIGLAGRIRPSLRIPVGHRSHHTGRPSARHIAAAGPFRLIAEAPPGIRRSSYLVRSCGHGCRRALPTRPRARRRERPAVTRAAGGRRCGRASSAARSCTRTRGETAPCRPARRSIATRRRSSCTCSGRGLDDERYVVETYRSLRQRRDPNPSEAGQPRDEGPAQAAPEDRLAQGAFKQMRPERDEIIVCTGVNAEARIRGANIGALARLGPGRRAQRRADRGGRSCRSRTPRGRRRGIFSNRQRHAERVGGGVRARAAAGFPPSPASRFVAVARRKGAPPIRPAATGPGQQGKLIPCGRDPERCRRADRAGDSAAPPGAVARRRTLHKSCGRRRPDRTTAPSASHAARQGVHSTAGAMPTRRAAGRCVRCARSPRSVDQSRCGRCARAGEGARLTLRGRSAVSKKTIRRAARARGMCGLRGAHGRRGAVSGLRVPV